MKKAVLFDLDGTLFDTGPDFEYIMNKMRPKLGLGKIDYADFKPHIALGSAAMTQFAFQITAEDERYQELLEQFYAHYLEDMGKYAQVFPDIIQTLTALEQAHIPWGIVSNRQEAYMPRLLRQFELHERTQCIVGADTTPHRKPHPAPLLHAAKKLDVKPESCFYVGDYFTDIEAANAAGMHSIAVTWGYHNGLDTLSKAEFIIDKPEEILTIVNNA